MATWELLYNHVAPKPVEYVRSIVSYLDILGFQELVESKTAGELSQTLRVLAESTKPDKLFKPAGLSSRSSPTPLFDAFQKVGIAPAEFYLS
jgi:hypothetical protein